MATVKREKKPENITITTTELILQPVDRGRADIKKWWRSLQIGEQITNPNRGPLLDLCDRARLDGNLSGLIEKRTCAVLNKKLHYEVKGKRIDENEDLIQSEKFRLMMRLLHQKKYWGFTGLEFIPGTDLNFELIPRKHIKTEKKIIAIEQNGQTGFDYTQMWNIVVFEDVEKFGLLLKCCPYTIWKSGSLGDLAQYIELYGQPIRKATYPGDDHELKESLKQALKEMGGSFSILIPDGSNLEIIGDHVTNGNGEAHQVLFTNVNNELSIIILGNTETTSNENGGSNAKSQVHSKQQDEITKSDLKDMQDMLSCPEMKKIFQSYGYKISPDDNGVFVFEQDADLDALSSKKDIWLAVSAKVPIDPDDWYNTFFIPKPAKFDEMYRKMEEERTAKINPPQPVIPQKNKQQEKNKKRKLAAMQEDIHWFKRILNKIDFFGHGHKD